MAHLYRYSQGLESGTFDKDLSDEDRAEVARLLRMGLNILHNFGGTPARDLKAMLRDPQATEAVNSRVADILFGCLTPGWTRTAQRRSDPMYAAYRADVASDDAAVR